MSLPTPSDVARMMPALIAAAGGSIEYQDLELGIDRKFRPAIEETTSDPAAFLRELFNSGLTIAVNTKLLSITGSRLLLNDRGWIQASADPVGDTARRLDQGLDRSRFKPAVSSTQMPNESARRRHGRRPGATWPTLVCESIHELGGHADWRSIAAALERLPEASELVGWREESMQALSNNTGGRGRSYFEAAEVDGHPVFSLTENGRKLVKRRSQDDRAPTLSKHLAEAVNGDADKLTHIEVFTLLFLATRLGRVQDARRLYDRLPANFPDEDSYAMIPIWIDQAQQINVSSEWRS